MKQFFCFISPSCHHFIGRITYFLILSTHAICNAQTISKAEYFFDHDPGPGNGISLNISSPDDTISFAGTVNTIGLAQGRHLLYVRTKTSDGHWSLFEPREFYIRLNIVEAEYFIDTDPGIGNGTRIAVATPSDDATFNSTITVGVLSFGIHYLFMRTKDAQGKWSLYEPQAFNVSDPLPIELLSFSAEATQDHSARLTWATASEKNNDYFTVHHSQDAFDFSEVARIPGAGNSLLLLKYEVIHDRPSGGMNYYRLQQTDYDGKSSYSEIVALHFSKEKKPMVYPVPTTGEWFVDFSGMREQETFDLEVWDVTGRKCYEQKHVGKKLIRFDGNQFLKGNYILFIKSEGHKVLIEKLIFY